MEDVEGERRRLEIAHEQKVREGEYLEAALLHFRRCRLADGKVNVGGLKIEKVVIPWVKHAGIERALFGTHTHQNSL